MTLVETMIAAVVKEIHGLEVPLPFQRLTYQEAMDRYGSDKPDLRFGLEIHDLTTVLKDTTFQALRGALDNGGVIRAINAVGMAPTSSRKQLDELTATAKLFGAKGLVWLKVEDNGAWSGSAAKFFTDAEKSAVNAAMAAKPGDLLLMAADSWRCASEVMGRLRLELAAKAGLNETPGFKFLWVVNFPLLDWDEETERFVAVHHPFTSPLDEDVALLTPIPAKSEPRPMTWCSMGSNSEAAPSGFTRPTARL